MLYENQEDNVGHAECCGGRSLVADNPTLRLVASLAVAAYLLYLECCDYADAATDMFTSSCGH